MLLDAVGVTLTSIEDSPDDRFLAIIHTDGHENASKEWSVDKIRALRAMIGTRQIHIEIDGGVTVETAPLVVAAGADVLVAGTATFKGGPDCYAANIAALKGAA